MIITKVEVIEFQHEMWNHGYVSRAEIKGNELHLTEGPGFGVEISRDYLDRYGTKLE